MSDVTITFDNKPNDSLQVGDYIFYTATETDGAYKKNKDETYKLGQVKSIVEDTTTVDGVLVPNGDWNVVVDKDDAVPNVSQDTDYVYFVKDNRVNYSGVAGYYAEVELTNNKKSKAELFSVASEISESSK
jgi:hypothetical protein